jgi:hypothetical protein
MTSRQNKRRLMQLVSVAAISFVGLIAILALRWPFSKSTVSESIQKIIPGTVQIAKFRSIYFPHPGCIAEGVVLVQSSSASDTPPLFTVQRVSMQANYLDLFLSPGYIARIVLNGLRVHVPARGSGTHTEINSAAQSGSIPIRTRVGEIVADSAVLEVARHGDKPPLKFAIHLLTLNSVTRDKPFSYRVALTNALPPGEIVSSGQLGPWNSRALGETPVSGSYTFQQANLGVFGGIAGTLSSEDSFEGALGHIDVHGKIQIPDFEVKRSNHRVHLNARFLATVNATNGDVFLHQVQTSILQTEVETTGSIAGVPGKRGKTTSLDFNVRSGRIQDVLGLFVKRAPMSGITSFRAHALVPTEGRPFLEELFLKGDFAINSGHFTSPETQARVDDLSRRAHSENKSARHKEVPEGIGENVAAKLDGHVMVRDGVARFADVSFYIPSASAYMDGTYNLLNEQVDFRGTLKTEAKLSQTTTGIKSVLLKPFDPFFKKKRSGATIPVEMTGTYNHPHFGIDLTPRTSRDK